MGGSYSKEDEELFMSDLFNFASNRGLMPDIGIDCALLKYSGLDSTAVLEDYSSQLVNEVVSKAPTLVEGLGSAFASVSAVPNAVGLGALIISIILELAISSSSLEPRESTADMLRRVFAEEKASSVRDSMNEYLKRLSMHVHEPLKALEETERLEKELSKQLTALRNSILTDNQMSSRSMKHWVNGAAFHSQMLVHSARLKMAGITSNRETELKIRVSSISNVVGIYQKDFQVLLEKYKDYKTSNVKLETATKCLTMDCVDLCRVRDYETPQIILPGIEHAVSGTRYCARSSEAYVTYMFNNWSVIKKLESYFSDLKKNLRGLILQHQAFNPPKI